MTRRSRVVNALLIALFGLGLFLFWLMALTNMEVTTWGQALHYATGLPFDWIAQFILPGLLIGLFAIVGILLATSGFFAVTYLKVGRKAVPLTLIFSGLNVLLFEALLFLHSLGLASYYGFSLLWGLHVTKATELWTPWLTNGFVFVAAAVVVAAAGLSLATGVGFPRTKPDRRLVALAVVAIVLCLAAWAALVLTAESMIASECAQTLLCLGR
jgi:hypothetical protein